MTAWNKKQGAVDSGNGNERDPKASPTPTTGFQESPKGEQAGYGPGEGIGANKNCWK